MNVANGRPSRPACGRRAAGAPSLSGTDNGVRSLAARPLVNQLELSSRPGEMAFEPAKASIESLESSDPIRDVGAPIGDEPRQLGGGVGAVAGMTPTRDLAGIPERDVEPAKLDQQPQMLNVRSCVVAVVVIPPRGAREPSRTLVEADGVGRDTNLSCQFADSHGGSKPWSGSNVKGSPPSDEHQPTSRPTRSRQRPREPLSRFSLRRRSSRSGPALPSAAITGPSNRQRPWG